MDKYYYFNKNFIASCLNLFLYIYMPFKLFFESYIFFCFSIRVVAFALLIIIIETSILLYLLYMYISNYYICYICKN